MQCFSRALICDMGNANNRFLGKIKVPRIVKCPRIANCSSNGYPYGMRISYYYELDGYKSPALIIINPGNPKLQLKHVFVLDAGVLASDYQLHDYEIGR